ncbi:MAG: molybdenum cofactor biosynthesis protein C [Candidatus Muproteobacteria bacterium RBG_16_65_34]|uniref:Cyclic pyranopterin monophosphate synthase n=1 Tax=Candidatus Muproteobacteria bacterium RBG_16_65_34 TaxID=1817760 RepID=A0A1F6TUR2_9PROT|nr:MAG: molybdenum cofactor biosynthesis protein C [Candidatus Muproteobacteria bacterium RBG_16_65_34]
MSKLTHLNESGEAHMVDVGAKPVTARAAAAEGLIRMQPETLRLIMEGGHKKGDVLAVARVAGILAAKKTAELIPLCHAIPLSSVEIELTPDTAQSLVHARATARTQAQTGVEMEALTAVEIALLTIYDMCKAVDRGMTITDIRLLSKSGGRSGEWKREG